MSDKGRVWPGEIEAGQDAQTGAVVWQVTGHPSINHNLYFLTNSFLPDERSLVFAGFRTGSANFFRAGFPQGDIVQLTDAPGINSFSAVISDDGSRLYFTRGNSVVKLELDSLREDVLGEVPGGSLGEVNLSCDGRWIVSAARFKGENGIVVIATDGSGTQVIHRQENVIIHPQFHPADPDVIEYANDPAPRMHLIRRDGTGHEVLYEHDNDEFIVHETWLGRTGDLVFTVWPTSLKRMRLPSHRIETIAEFNAWHICPSADGRFILCDTNCPDRGVQLVDVAGGSRRTVCYPASSNGGSQWAKGTYATAADFEEAARRAGTAVEAQCTWMEMKTDTVYGPQWSHPHPALTRSGRLAAFTSDRTGRPQVYVVAIG
ncbi:MAG: PD40 domain-containing protein [Planctomycetes bacterium]|nr:PD40 domain-containing protein [Planctomycetota bacterium]